MSLIDMSQFDRVRVDDVVHAELAGPRRGETVVAIRTDGLGDLVMGVAGPVDGAMADRIAALLRDLRPPGSVRMVVTLSRLGAWDPHLARVLGLARIQQRDGGGHLELHDAPAALLAALDPPPGAASSRRRAPGRGIG